MTYPVKLLSRFCLLLTLFLATACAPQMAETQNQALPTLAQPLQLVQNATAYPAAQPTQTAAPSATTAPTQAPSATQVPTAAPTATALTATGPSALLPEPFEACDTPPMYEASYPLPDPAALHWEAANVQGQTYQALAGLNVPPVSASADPSGRWWMVDLLQQPGQGGPSVTALYLLDTREGKHWLVSKQGWDVEHRYEWLADGRLLWVDEGHLYLGGLDGQNRQDLSAPAAVREVWAAAAQGRALVTDGNQLWRLDLASGQWDAVSGLPALSSGSYNLTLSPDGADAAVMLSGQIWKVPMSSGAAAQKLAEIQYGGRGGRISAPEALANSPYWSTGEMILDANGTALSLLNAQDGKLLSPAEVDPALEGSSTAMQGPGVSPDRRWVAFNLLEGETSKGVYIAPSDNLPGGKLYPGRMVAGWRAQPDMAYLLTAGDPPQIAQVDLTSGEQKTLSDWVSDIDNMQRLLTPPNLTVIISGGQVRRFKLDGSLQDQWAAPKFTFAFPSWANAGPTGDLLFNGTSAQKVNGACQVNYRLLLFR